MGLLEMHHMITPYQRIVYPPQTDRGANAAAVSYSNKTVAFNEPGCSLFKLFIVFPYQSDDLSDSIYIFNNMNKLFAD